MEHEYQDIVVRTQFLKDTKQRIKKDIEFYKNVIAKLVKFKEIIQSFTYDIPTD